MKRFLKIIAVILSLIIVVVTGFLVANRVQSGNYSNFNKNDKVILKELSNIYRAFRETPEEIWTEDYDFSEIPIIVTPVKKERGVWHSYSYAINVDGLETSLFAKLIELPDEFGVEKKVYRVSAFSPFSWPASLPIDSLFISKGAQKVYFFKCSAKGVSNVDNMLGFQYVMIHEAFREFRQLAVWDNVLSGKELQKLYNAGEVEKAGMLGTAIDISKYSSEVYQLMILEVSLLDRALNGSNISEMRDYLSDWGRVRRYRNRKYPFTSQEKRVETLEGSAQYNERAYARRQGLDYTYAVSRGDEKYSLKQLLTDDKIVNTIIESGRLYALFSKNLYYSTGSTLGLIYDEIGIEWKPKVESRALLPDIGIEALNIEESVDEREIDSIKDRYSYSSYEKAALKIAENIYTNTF